MDAGRDDVTRANNVFRTRSRPGNEKKNKNEIVVGADVASFSVVRNGLEFRLVRRNDATRRSRESDTNSPGKTTVVRACCYDRPSATRERNFRVNPMSFAFPWVHAPRGPVKSVYTCSRARETPPPPPPPPPRLKRACFPTFHLSRGHVLFSVERHRFLLILRPIPRRHLVRHRGGGTSFSKRPLCSPPATKTKK